MSYLVKELFTTLQGEGRHAGRRAVFCRFAGCNLWSGREEHRATAVCRFCDTDFVGTDGPGGGRFAGPDDLADAVVAAWRTGLAPHVEVAPFVVCTGGEPLLQLDAPLIDALHARGAQVAVETNGTIDPPAGLDWVCVSPKAGSDVVVRRGDELKVVVPQDGLDLDELVTWSFTHHLVQPMDGPDAASATALAVAVCHADPRWRLSVQTHKLVGIP